MSHCVLTLQGPEYSMVFVVIAWHTPVTAVCDPGKLFDVQSRRHDRI